MANDRQAKATHYCFDGVVVDCENFRILKNGESRTLMPRGFDVLTFLIEHRGRVVEKKKLFEQIWKETFVTDNALTRVIKEIRKVLGDDADAPRYIETVPKRGYRFIAEIQPQPVDNANRTEAQKSLAPTAPKTLPSIAVLPFKLFAAGNNDYLGLGLADALITRLSNLRQIIVRPTSAVLKYAQGEQNPSLIGNELQTAFVLEGSVRKAGARVRATVQLVSVDDGRSLWAGKFDEDFTDIFTVEDAIAERVAEALALRLNSEEKLRLTKHYTDDAEAYEFYLKGRYYANQFTLETFYKAIESFDRALDLDPDFALAYAGIAEAYWIAADLYLNPLEAVTKTKEATSRAIALDDTLAEGHTYLACALYTLDWDWVGLEREFRRAIELNPGFAPAHHWFSWCLSVMGRHDEAVREIERARQFDPFSLGINWFLSAIYGFAGRYEEALATGRNFVELAPHFWAAHWALANCHERLGNYSEAIAAYEKAAEFDSSPMITGSIAHFYALIGKTGKARKMLAELKALEKTSFVPPYYLAMILGALEEADEAFEYLEKAYEIRDSSLPAIQVDARMDKLRADPRLRDLARRIGLAA